jgi:phage shock protein E
MSVTRLTPAEFQAQQQAEPGVLLDVRTPSEFEGGYLEGATNYDFLGGVFNDAYPAFDKNATYYLYCASGNRSGKAAQQMLDAGFAKVYNVGGFQELAGAGLPVAY